MHYLWRKVTIADCGHRDEDEPDRVRQRKDSGVGRLGERGLARVDEAAKEHDEHGEHVDGHEERRERALEGRPQQDAAVKVAREAEEAEGGECLEQPEPRAPRVLPIVARVGRRAEIDARTQRQHAQHINPQVEVAQLAALRGVHEERDEDLGAKEGGKGRIHHEEGKGARLAPKPHAAVRTRLLHDPRGNVCQRQAAHEEHVDVAEPGPRRIVYEEEDPSPQPMRSDAIADFANPVHGTDRERGEHRCSPLGQVPTSVPSSADS